MNKAKIIAMLAAVSTFCLPDAHAQSGKDRPKVPRLLKEVSPQQQDQIWEAAPDKPRAEPKKKRLVLISCTHGGHWYVAPRGAHMFQVLGLKSGAYDMIVSSNDAAMFLPESLARFDAVILNNEGVPSNDEAMDKLKQYGDRATVKRLLRESLLDFLARGGGLVGVHAAPLAYGDDMEYRWMWGAGYAGHPWHEEIGIKLDEPNHPLVAALGGENFRLHDEIYRFRPPYTREYVRVLMSIDIENTDMEPRSVYYDGRVKREGDPDDFALAWIHRYGQGRVFYCALGHVNDVYWHPKLSQFFLDGVQFAMGDLDVPTLPSAWGGDKFDFEAIKNRFAAAEGLDKTGILRAMPYYAGQEAVPIYIEAAQDKDPQIRMAAFRALGSCGNADALPLLAEAACSAGEADVKEAARSALARMRGDGVEPAMIALAADADEMPETRAEIIRALAARKAGAALKTVLATARDADADVRLASMNALSAIADISAADDLVALVKNAKSGDEQSAAAGALASAVRAAGAPEQVLAKISSEFDKADPQGRGGLILAMGGIGGLKALEIARRALEDKETIVHDAAVRAMANWPDPSPIEDLLNLATDGKSEEERAAALAGHARMIGMKKDLPPEQACEMFQAALDLTERDEEKKLIFAGLGRISDPQALRTLEQSLEEMRLMGEEGALPFAEAAYVDVAVSLIESNPKEAKTALEQIAGASENKELVERAVKAAQNMK